MDPLKHSSPGPDFLIPRRGPSRARSGFRFGVEAEFLLVEAETYRPLWHQDLDFAELDALLESIPVADLPSCAGLAATPPHRRRMPFYVEGYHVPDPETPGAELRPKGIEIRTPARSSIDEAVALLGELHERLQEALTGWGYRAVALGHHPTEDRFEGPQGSRSPDKWQWSQQVMTTFGPDVNVGLPPHLASRLDEADLWAKVNHYAPALVALTLNAPLLRGDAWRVNGQVGRSVRTYRRSPFGQMLEFHPDQAGRLEFKGFEMSHRLADYRGMLLLWLTVLLDSGLKGRADDRRRIGDLLTVAVTGLEASSIRERAAEVLGRAPAVLAAWGFDPRGLEPFARRLATRRTPADEVLALFEQEGSIPGVLRHLDRLIPDLASAPRSSAPALAS